MGKQPLFLTIDAGTTRFKAALVSPDGRIEARREYYYPRVGDLFHEYHTGEFVKALEHTLPPLSGMMKNRGLLGAGVTGHGPTLIPVDRSGSPLYPGVGYLDDRVKRYIRMLVERAGDLVTSTMYIPIGLFFREEQPRIYGNTYRFLQSFDYLVYLLTGEYTASASSRGIRPWDRAALGSSGLDGEKFPEVSYMGSEIGRTSRAVSAWLDVPEGTPVRAVGVDFAAALVGAGTMAKGRSCERAGSSGGVNLCWDAPVPERRLLCYETFVPGLWNVAGITSTSGKAIDWAARVLGVEKPREFPYGALPKKILFFPYLKGERTPLWDPYVKGAFFGVRAEHTRWDLLESVYLGTALGILDCIRLIERCGCEFREPVVATGWGARDDGFVQLKADVMGKPFVKIQTKDAELLGVAIVLAASGGCYGSLQAAASAMIETGRVFVPDASRAPFFEEMFSLYREMQGVIVRNKLIDEG